MAIRANQKIRLIGCAAKTINHGAAKIEIGEHFCQRLTPAAVGGGRADQGRIKAGIQRRKALNRRDEIARFVTNLYLELGQIIAVGRKCFGHHRIKRQHQRDD